MASIRSHVRQGHKEEEEERLFASAICIQFMNRKTIFDNKLMTLLYYVITGTLLLLESFLNK